MCMVCCTESESGIKAMWSSSPAHIPDNAASLGYRDCLKVLTAQATAPVLSLLCPLYTVFSSQCLILQNPRSCTLMRNGTDSLMPH